MHRFFIRIRALIVLSLLLASGSAAWCQFGALFGGGVSDSDFNDAVQSANIDQVKLGIKKKIDVNKAYQGTPYILSALRYRDDGDTITVIDLLVKAGAKVDAPALKAQGSGFDDGETALMRASSTWSVSAVKFLLDSKADPNARDASGGNALTYAFKENRKECLPVVELPARAGSRCRTDRWLGSRGQRLVRNWAGACRSGYPAGIGFYR